MDVYETIKNIHSSCDNYVDPELVATVIDENGFMGKNNITELDSYGFSADDRYEDMFMKVHEKENIFVTFGMLNFIPLMEECDIFSVEDETIEIAPSDYEENCDEQEVFFGIMIEKGTSKYQIGLTDLCNCKVGSCFKPLKNSESELYKKLEEIIEKRIIS